MGQSEIQFSVPEQQNNFEIILAEGLKQLYTNFTTFSYRSYLSLQLSPSFPKGFRPGFDPETDGLDKETFFLDDQVSRRTLIRQKLRGMQNI